MRLRAHCSWRRRSWTRASRRHADDAHVPCQTVEQLEMDSGVAVAAAIDWKYHLPPVAGGPERSSVQVISISPAAFAFSA